MQAMIYICEHAGVSHAGITRMSEFSATDLICNSSLRRSASHSLLFYRLII